MSLLERVERAGNGACPREGAEGALGLDALKEQVQMIVSADEVAALQAENPGRARSEVRSACRRVFESLAWADVPAAQRARLEGELLDTVFGFGPLEGLLADDTVTEIMVNGPRSVYFERDGRLYRSEQRFADEDQLRALVDRVLGPLGRRIDESSPMVNARLPQGHRVHAVIPPLALDGPVLTIRKFARRVMTLADMEALGSFDGAMRTFLTWAVRARKSVAVSGGTGSGKTTLLNALSCAIPHEERIITIEDSAELRFLEHPHVVRLEARPRNAEGRGEVTIRDLVTNALRMRPDRIVVGECRGAEALDMLQAMNTGHDGSLTTLHANSPGESVARLTTMVRYGADLPVDVIEANIASAIDLVVQTARALDGSRRIAEVVTLSYDRERRRCVVDPLFKRREAEARGTWAAVPAWIADLPSRGCAGRAEVDAWMRGSATASRWRARLRSGCWRAPACGGSRAGPCSYWPSAATSPPSGRCSPAWLQRAWYWAPWPSRLRGARWARLPSWPARWRRRSGLRARRPTGAATPCGMPCLMCCGRWERASMPVSRCSRRWPR